MVMRRIERKIVKWWHDDGVVDSTNKNDDTDANRDYIHDDSDYTMKYEDDNIDEDVIVSDVVENRSKK